MSLANDWLWFNLEGQAKELREREQRCRKAYTKDSALHAATNDLADCHAAAALIYETALRQVPKRRRGGCPICGGEFAPAIDNFGESYSGCVRCIIKPAP